MFFHLKKIKHGIKAKDFEFRYTLLLSRLRPRELHVKTVEL